MQQGMLRSNMPECEDMFGFGFGSGWEMDFYSTSFCLIRLGFLLGFLDYDTVLLLLLSRIALWSCFEYMNNMNNMNTMDNERTHIVTAPKS